MKYIYILLISIACLTLLGCGGGGGGGDNGVTLTPQQQEFADAVYSFATAVNNKNKADAINIVLPELVYNKTLEYSEFKTKLDAFIDKVTTVNFQINEVGVIFLDANEDLAEVRADVTITYNTSNVIQEILELNVEKYGSKFGIKKFQKYPDDGNDITAFPPTL